jgi:hypothetical protein
MINVWAYRKQDLGSTFTVAGEWNQVILFDTLPDLLEKFTTANIPKGQVRKLGIVAHGDKPGRVQMKPVDLTATTAGQFKQDFDILRDYLWKNARIVFYSCIAGQTKEGSALLNELSGKYFPDRHVIGFEKFGLASGGQQPAGELRCSEQTVDGKARPEFYCSPTATLRTVTDLRRQTEQILSEYAIYAKWSFRGKIIKVPLSEIIQSTYLAPEVICGPEAVLSALEDPTKRAQVEYIAINTKKNPSKKLVNLFNTVQKLGFEWSNSPVPKKRMHEFSDVERKLVSDQKGQLRKGEEIVAVCEKKLIQKFRCAWVSCPTHENKQDYCKPPVEHIPNGPLV